jgi:hypothetical protein
VASLWGGFEARVARVLDARVRLHQRLSATMPNGYMGRDFAVNFFKARARPPSRPAAPVRALSSPLRQPLQGVRTRHLCSGGPSLDDCDDTLGSEVHSRLCYSLLIRSAPQARNRTRRGGRRARCRAADGACGAQAHEAMDALKASLREEHVIIFDYLTRFHEVAAPALARRPVAECTEQACDPLSRTPGWQRGQTAAVHAPRLGGRASPPDLRLCGLYSRVHLLRCMHARALTGRSARRS